MAAFRCGGTGLVRDHVTDPALARTCPGCSDCSRCHGTKQLFRFIAIMIDGKHAATGGYRLYGLKIEVCPGCVDCETPEVLTANSDREHPMRNSGGLDHH